MSGVRKSDRALMKQTNQHLVLQLIRGQGPISRKEIAQRSRLSPASVSMITAELIERGLVQEVGAAEAEGRAGRRAVLLRLNPLTGFVVGVKLAVRLITCVLTDLDANVLYTSETRISLASQNGPASEPFPPHAMIDATVQAVEQLLAQARIDRSRLLGIGVGVNGVVDAENGICRTAPHFGWRNVPLAAPLAAHFGIPVLLENDARTLTIAEQWFGAGRGIDHFVTIAIGYGIGSGVVSNGVMSRGSIGGAGEFGHIPMQPGGPACSCGKHGCLESLAAEPAMIRQVQEALAAAEQSLLSQCQPLTLEAIAGAAEAGDALAQRILGQAGHWLGVGMAALVNILNPELVIINGEAVCAGRWYFEPMEAALRAHAFDGLADALRIVTEPGGNDMWARGAACVVLSALFSAPLQRQESDLARSVSALGLG